MVLKAIKNNWYRFSIKNKQLIFIGIIILCVSFISIYIHAVTHKSIEQLSKSVTDYSRINNLLVQLRINKLFVESYLKEKKVKDLNEYKQSKDIIKLVLDQIEAKQDTTQSYFLIAAIKNGLVSYYEGCNTALEIRQSGDENYYVHFFQAARIYEYIEHYIRQLLHIKLSENSRFYDRLIDRASIMRTITFAGILAMSIICLGFGLLFSNYLTKPVRKLAAASLQMSKGNLDVKQIEVRSLDEVAVLANAFNKMSMSIRRLVTDLKQKSAIEKRLYEEKLKNITMQQLLKEANFLALQSQINPHFLFNTLNIISRTSMFEQAVNTTNLIQSLSKLFRYSITNQNSNVTLTEEIKIVEEYMHIQMYRFGSRIKFDLRCDIDTDDIIVPCFILQPLVENAIIHGIESKENGGMVRVKIVKRDEIVLVKIIDNGAGIPKSRLEEVLNREKETHMGHTNSIGIMNVLNRVNLYCNDKKCFKIKSKVNLGTLVVISFPAKGGERKIV